MRRSSSPATDLAYRRCSQAHPTNALNQYSAVNGITHTYDKRANLTSDGVWTYGYDTENRLISATNAATSTTASYTYDALDRRMYKTVNGVIMAWASYGNQEVAEYVGSGTVNLTRRFVYGAGIDEPLASVDVANARTYQFQDALGSVIALANGTRMVTQHSCQKTRRNPWPAKIATQRVHAREIESNKDQRWTRQLRFPSATALQPCLGLLCRASCAIEANF